MNTTSSTVRGVIAGRITPGTVVTIDGHRWQVTYARTLLGYTNINFIQTPPTPGLRPATWSGQYKQGHQFTVIPTSQAAR